jgi:hypothetical protein
MRLGRLKLSAIAPPNLQVIKLEQDLDDPAQLSQQGDEVSKQLAQATDIEPAVVAAKVVAVSHEHFGLLSGEPDEPQSGWEMNLAPSTIGPGVLTRIINGAFPPTVGGGKRTTAPPPGTQLSQGPGNGSGQECGRGDAKAGSDSPPPAAAISAIVPALADPTKLWDYLSPKDRGQVAKDLIEVIYGDRSRLTQRSEWIVSPEMSLLGASPEDQQKRLAEELLRVRGQLTDADVKTRDAWAELAVKEDQLVGKRVELAGEGVKLAEEMRLQMQKWRLIAKYGLWALAVTTLFAMTAISYMFMYLMPGGKVGEVAAPIIVFALALFAISPAVLLLRERPLEGLDKWSPGGGNSEGSGESGNGGSSGSSGGEGTPSSQVSSATPTS